VRQQVPARAACADQGPAVPDWAKGPGLQQLKAGP
jgi:hypothetical protein